MDPESSIQMIEAILAPIINVARIDSSHRV